MISRAPANGAPRAKKHIDTASSETMRLSRACTGLVLVTTSRVEATATAAAK
ncbi:hypothetical protein D3C77_684940 [compost metagenome]